MVRPWVGPFLCPGLSVGVEAWSRFGVAGRGWFRIFGGDDGWLNAANLGASAGRREVGEILVDSWSPDFRPRKWERDKEQFAAWMAGADVRSLWKRRRFGIWREKQFSAQMRVARDAEQKRQAELMANPSA